MAEQQLKSLTPDWLTEVEKCALSKPDRQRPTIKGVWMWVDRGVAEGLLAMNTWNRDIRQKRVDGYADLMARGLWDECTPQMIVFDTDLKMADGQHRCLAVVKSQASLWCLVVWGIDPVARLNIDRGGIRNSADNLQMAGMGDLLPGNGKRALELANAFVQGMRPSKVSLAPAELQSVCERYGDVFATTTEIFEKHTKNTFFSRATVRAVVARALAHGVNEGVLRSFVEILISGYATGQPGDRAVVTLRNFYVNAANENKKKGGVNSNDNARIYAMCASALKSYIRGDDRVLIRPVGDDPWPIDAAVGAVVGADRVVGNVRRPGIGGLPIDFLVEARVPA